LSTGVIEFLRIKAMDTVIVGGLALDYCVKTTAIQLAKAGFRVIVNVGACRGIEQISIDAAFEEMQAAHVHVIQSINELTLSNDY
jgi:nicotinamidase/pyrazinamidase